jgi:hypothetical protein
VRRLAFGKDANRVQLDVDCADLNRGLGFGVIWDIVHNFRAVGRRGFLECGDGFEIEVSQRSVPRKRTGSYPVDSFFHGNVQERGAEELADEGNVFRE